MTTALTCASESDCNLVEVVAQVQARHRGHVRELWLEPINGGLRLCGRATCFYGKQIVFHELCDRCKLPIIANDIAVLPA